jgi:uncharacterized protein (TIGR03435 family)
MGRVAAILIALLPCNALCQSVSFETASISPGAAGTPSAPIRVTRNGIVAANATLKQLVAFAFDLHEIEVSGPAWIDVGRYDVTARTSSPTAPEQLRLMLQKLLEDRLAFISHRERREIPVYWLVVAEGGAKLRNPSEEGAFKAAFAARSPFKPGVDAIFTNKDLPGFARRLAPATGRPVIDKTGIEGNDWFQLEWVPGRDQRGQAATSLLKALQEQLGLALQDKTAPAQVIVIDSAIQP